MENYIVWLVVVVAGLYLLRKGLKAWSKSTSGGNCDSCGGCNNCGGCGGCSSNKPKDKSK